ncbi:MAG: hypothetical protein JO083_09920 [Candidatus Eremiobacteraeota bacterium]|nr:hypothetical protein [Candidatus Eremiobacteraeota bacterium]
MEPTANPQGKLPLIVGVTGHRDLRPADCPRLEAEVETIFARLKRDFPHTPLVVLSALAEGADRLVARVGLAHGATLVAPMPMPEEDYRTDFTAPESLAEFERLRAQAHALFVVPFDDPDHPAGAPLEGAARDRRYAAAGAYIAVNSDVLIALWDGRHPGRVGGTACIVEYKLRGVPEPYARRPSPLDGFESGPVYHITTPRAHIEAVPDKAFALEVRYPQSWNDRGEAAAFYDRIYRRVDTFNRDSLQQGVLTAPETELRSPAGELHAIADRLAIVYQQKAYRALLAIFWIVGLSVTAFEVYAHLHGSPGWLAADALGFVAATIIFLLARRAAFEERYQDYRALAEGLRILHFWRVAGIADSVAGYYLRKQKSELDWIRDSIRSCRVLADAVEARAPERRPLGERLQAVYDEWILGQGAWFRRAALKEERRAEAFSAAASVAFFGGLFVALVVAAYLGLNRTDLDGAVRERFVVAVALSAVIAGLLHNYSEKRAWSSHVKQYRRMQLIFARAATHLKSLIEESPEQNLPAARDVLRDLGREALIENGDWLLLHRERPIDVPGG